MTARVDYFESVERHCVANTLFLTLEQVFGRIKSLSVCIYNYVDRKVMVKQFVPPQEVASLSQQGRITAAQRACEIFSIE